MLCWSICHPVVHIHKVASLSSIRHSIIFTLLGRSGSGHQCIIGALDDLKRAYNYSLRPKVLSSYPLISSLNGKNALGSYIGKITAIYCYSCIDVQMEIGKQQDAHEFLVFLVKCLVKTLPKK